MSPSIPLPETPDGPPLKDRTDSWLMRRYQGGNQDAAQQLYVRYADRLHALAEAKCSSNLKRRLEADDIVQSVFRTFFRRVLEQCYDVPAGKDLWMLFQVIALNKIRAGARFHRAAKRDVRLTAPVDCADPGLEGHMKKQDDFAEEFLKLVVQDALQHLQPHQRQIVELRMQGYEVAEIADRIGRAKRTVERILQDTRQHLTALLDQEEHDA